MLRCKTGSRVRFPTEVNREDKHRIRPDGKPGSPVRDERGEMLDVDVGVDTMAPERFDRCCEGRSPIGTASLGARSRVA